MHDAALQGGSGPSASAKRIYVGGIPFETREAELREFFEAVMQKGRGCKLLFRLSSLPVWAECWALQGSQADRQGMQGF